MSRARRLAKPFLALGAIAAVALVVSGCAIVQPGSFSLSQPGGIGSVRVHFNLCTAATSTTSVGCGQATKSETVQYLTGIAVPPGSTPPASFTAQPIGGGAPVVFTRNDEVATQMAASSAAFEKFIAEFEAAGTPEEKAEAALIHQLYGGPWPPSGLQGVGYISAPVSEVKEQGLQWSVDADFGLPVPADGSPYVGPFASGVAMGLREVSEAKPANRPVRCLILDKAMPPTEFDSACGGTTAQGQLGTSDLRIEAPKKAAQAFVGGSGQLSFPLEFATTGGTPPSFALSATSTAKGAKFTFAPKTYKPGKVDPTSHLAPAANGKVTVAVPKSVKPGTYKVTLNATASQGAGTSQVGTLKVVKAKIKFGGVKADPAKGTATLKVKVPGAGKVTISGKGVKKAKKKAKKKGTVKLTIKPTGATASRLAQAGTAKTKVKVTFKPTSGVAVSKKKSVTLKLR